MFQQDQRNGWGWAGVLAGLLISASAFGATVRIKDIAHPEFERDNPLIGYGLVVGLNATGDDTSNLTTTQAIQQYQSMLSEYGRGLKLQPANKVEAKNSAIVIVTANLPPYARAGTRVQVTISSQFDAKSLEGGTLVPTAMRGLDGKVYAMAQGEVAVGGFSTTGRGGGAGQGTQENHPTVGTITGGAILERNANFLREYDRDRLNNGMVNFILKNPDFTQALNLQKAINESFHLTRMARALDPGTVEINLNGLLERYDYNSPMELIAEIERLELTTDLPARVIVSERTGVVIAGSDAKLSAVEIVHGDLRVVVTPAEPDQYIEDLGTAQITETGGDIRPGRIRTIEGKGQQVEVTESDTSLIQLKEGDTVGNLIQAISGPLAQKSPRDIVSILQALDKMGALHAELILVGD